MDGSAEVAARSAGAAAVGYSNLTTECAPTMAGKGEGEEAVISIKRSLPATNYSGTLRSPQ